MSTEDSQSPNVKSIRDRANSEQERIQELRERLYARGSTPARSVRHALPKHEIHETLEEPHEPPPPIEKPKEVREVVSVDSAPGTIEELARPDTVLYSEPMVSQGKRKLYRKKLALFGVIFFVCALVVSSFLMFSGNSTISGDNISLDVSGPIAIGGGEELQFQVSVANQNTVPIQSATLIIEYPKGTHSVEGGDKEILVERKQLDTVGTGELVNVPLKARVFGEENEEKEIKVSIDYRVAGSNATFHKEATPLRFKVSTSPIVMTFDSVKSIPSGQEIELKLTVQSNSPTPLTDILIKTTYPEGFNFTESNPDTVSGEDTWKIATLNSSEKKTISVKGLMTGYESEARKFTATAGVANATDKNTLASTLAKAQTEIFIEEPFINVGVEINGNSNENVVINSSEIANVEIKFENALDTAIYDGKVLVELSGNALNEYEVKVLDGFYDSTKNTITWDSVDETLLKEVLPGRSSTITFILDPKDDIGRAPEIQLKVTVKGQRVFEERPTQELVGTTVRTIKVESVPTITSSVVYSSGPFVNTGPTPPVAEKVTQYTYMLKVKTGTNDVTGAEVSAIIPQYVSWLDLVTPGDEVVYNATTRTMRWMIGDIDSNTEKEVGIQVSFLPSLSQVGTTPTILETQRFKATDRFTGTVIRTEHPALTTGLYDEADKEFKNGRVRDEE